MGLVNCAQTLVQFLLGAITLGMWAKQGVSVRLSEAASPVPCDL